MAMAEDPSLSGVAALPAPPTALISIIMPCRNAAPTLEEAIESVRSQDYVFWELLIIDDGSEDSCPSIIETYARKDSRIKSFRNPGPSGVARARNVGIQAASGRFLCFLDADDYLLPGSLRSRVAVAASGHAIVFGPYLRLTPTGHTHRCTVPARVMFADMLRRNHIGNLTGMYDVVRCGRLLQREIGHEDYLMWCELIRRWGPAIAVEAPPLAVYRVSSSSLSGNKPRAARWHWQVLRDGLGLSITSACWHFLVYTVVSVRSEITRRVSSRTAG